MIYTQRSILDLLDEGCALEVLRDASPVLPGTPGDKEFKSAVTAYIVALGVAGAECSVKRIAEAERVWDRLAALLEVPRLRDDAANLLEVFDCWSRTVTIHPHLADIRTNGERVQAYIISLIAESRDLESLPPNGVWRVAVAGCLLRLASDSFDRLIKTAAAAHPDFDDRYFHSSLGQAVSIVPTELRIRTDAETALERLRPGLNDLLPIIRRDLLD